MPRELATRIYDRAQRYQAVALAIDRYFYLGGLRPNLDFVESPSLLGMPRTFDHQNRGLLGLQLQVWESQGYIRWVLGSLPMDWRNTPLDIRGWDWRQFLQGENLFAAPSVGAVVDWSATPGNVRPNLEWFHRNGIRMDLFWRVEESWDRAMNDILPQHISIPYGGGRSEPPGLPAVPRRFPPIRPPPSSTLHTGEPIAMREAPPPGTDPVDDFDWPAPPPGTASGLRRDQHARDPESRWSLGEPNGRIRCWLLFRFDSTRRRHPDRGRGAFEYRYALELPRQQRGRVDHYEYVRHWPEDHIGSFIVPPAFYHNDDTPDVPNMATRAKEIEQLHKTAEREEAERLEAERAAVERES